MMKAKKVFEAIKHLPGRSEEEITTNFKNLSDLDIYHEWEFKARDWKTEKLLVNELKKRKATVELKKIARWYKLYNRKHFSEVVNESIKHLPGRTEQELQDLEKRGFRNNTGKWQFYIDITDILEAYNEDEDTETFRQSLISILKSKVSDIYLFVADEDEAMDFEDIISEFEMLDQMPEDEEIDYILDRLYDWADNNNVWINSF